MTKSKAGRPGKIQSEFPLERISTRISVEAIKVLDSKENKAVFIDSAIKKTPDHEHIWIAYINQKVMICEVCGESHKLKITGREHVLVVLDEVVTSACIHEFAPCDVAGQFVIQGGGTPTSFAKCTRCGYRP